MVGVYSDEGGAKMINVVPMKAQTKFIRNFTGALIAIGGAALGYVILRLAVMLFRWIAAQQFFLTLGPARVIFEPRKGDMKSAHPR